MPTVAGVDSCSFGWISVLVTFYDEIIGEEHHLLERFEDLFHLQPHPGLVAVDIPLGLLDEPEEGGRQCDRSARKVLGRPRASSVFSPPSRASLHCLDFQEAREYGLNKQSFGILPKVRELDRFMTPERQRFIREAHPEVSFYAMAGLAAPEASKKEPAGREDRVGLLKNHFYQIQEGLAAFPASRASAHDVLDAYACAWTAMRIFRGEAGCLPDRPETDSQGLRMEIWY